MTKRMALFYSEFIIHDVYLIEMFNKYIIYRTNCLVVIFIVVSFASINGCKKDNVVTPIEFQKQLLAGIGTFQNTQRKWKIDSVHVNGSPITLTPIQKNYYKIFVYDGSYSDYDLNEGEWQINTLDKLKQVIVYKSTGKIDSTLFDITKLNNYQLKLKLSTSDVEYTFKISN
jgi:hypothetical protein